MLHISSQWREQYIVGVTSVAKYWQQKTQISLLRGVVLSQSKFYLVLNVHVLKSIFLLSRVKLIYYSSFIIMHHLIHYPVIVNLFLAAAITHIVKANG